VLKAGKAFVAKNGGRNFTAIEFKAATGIDPGSIRNYFGNVDDFKREIGVRPPEEVVGDVVERIKVDRARVKDTAERKLLKEEAAAAEARARMAEARLEAAESLIGRFHRMPEIQVSNKKHTLPEATYFMLASDWHVGERVRPNEIGGRNEYKPEIATARAEQYFKSNLLMMNAARSAWSIDTAVLWIGGDLCTGYIHEEFVAENFLSPLEEMALAFDLMERGIKYLLNHGDLARLVVVTSNGNHGRTTKKVHAAGGFRNSYEFAMYKQLAKRFENEPRVTFQLGEGYYNDLRVYGEVIRFSHGDGVKFGGGVGGISVPFNRRIGREAQSVGRILLYCHGHFHTYDPGRRRVGNGSLIGFNSYADRNGFEFEEPMQASFVVDSRHKVVSNLNPILLVKRKK
jgi:hypothetical protein